MDCTRAKRRANRPFSRWNARFRVRTLVWAVVALVWAVPASGFVPAWIADPDYEHRGSALLRNTIPSVPPVDPSIAQGRDDFDVLRYRITILPSFDEQRIVGSVSVTFQSLVDGLSSIDLDLYDDWQIDLVHRNNDPLDYLHENDVLRISLSEPLSVGGTRTITVHYQGAPQPAGFMGLQFLESAGGARTLASLSQPYFARSWWPCKDTPTDKAEVDLYVIAPQGMFAASNGVLVGQQPVGNDTLYTWVETYPISTYNVSLAVAEYVSWSEVYVGPDEQQLTIEYHVFPEDEEAARFDFGRTTEIVDFFVDRFGEYPFIQEKFGMAEFVFVGAMEHQTMTSYGQFFLTGDRFYERIIGHELAHEWWGNSMTLTDWSELWIHEGLATLSEGLWLEHAQGPIAYRNFLRARSNSCCGFPGPISPPTELFNTTVYNKSAWMLHMLRRTIGDNEFFGALRDLAARPELRYGSIDTATFVEQFETSTGQQLSWFFDQWLYRTGRPTIASSWTAEPLGDRFRVEVNLEQTGPGEPWIFPLDLRVVTSAGNIEFQTWVTSVRHRYTAFVDAEPTDLKVDPNESLLWFADGQSPVTSVSPPLGGTRLLPNVPNPFNPRTMLRFELARAGDVELRILDVRGRVVDVLRPGRLGAGLHEFPWDGTDFRGAAVSSGVYQVQLTGIDGPGNVRPITLVR
jgi:aminopeptidase N